MLFLSKKDSEMSLLATAILTTLTENLCLIPYARNRRCMARRAAPANTTLVYCFTYSISSDRLAEARLATTVTSPLKQSDPAATRILESLARHLERNTVQLAPGNVFHGNPAKK
jgi:hypothetical protein